MPAHGGQPHSYWLRYGASVVLVTGEQLRFASEDELLAAHSVPQELLAPMPAGQGATSTFGASPSRQRQYLPRLRNQAQRDVGRPLH